MLRSATKVATTQTVALNWGAKKKPGRLSQAKEGAAGFLIPEIRTS
jgi:hypothetical protein